MAALLRERLGQASLQDASPHGHNNNNAAPSEAPLIAIHRFRPIQADVSDGCRGGPAACGSGQHLGGKLSAGVPWWLLKQDSDMAGPGLIGQSPWETAHKVRGRRPPFKGFHVCLHVWSRRPPRVPFSLLHVCVSAFRSTSRGFRCSLESQECA